MEPFILNIHKSQRLKWELTCDHVKWTFCTWDGLEAINSGPEVLSYEQTNPRSRPRGRVNSFKPRENGVLHSHFPGEDGGAGRSLAGGEMLLGHVLATTRTSGGTGSHSGLWGTPKRSFNGRGMWW